MVIWCPLTSTQKPAAIKTIIFCYLSIQSPAYLLDICVYTVIPNI